MEINMQKITSTEQYYLGGLLVEGECIAIRMVLEGQKQPVWVGAGSRKHFSFKLMKYLEKNRIKALEESWNYGSLIDEEEHNNLIATARNWFDNYLHPEQQVNFVKQQCWYHDDYDAPTDFEIVTLYKNYF